MAGPSIWTNGSPSSIQHGSTGQMERVRGLKIRRLFHLRPCLGFSPPYVEVTVAANKPSILELQAARLIPPTSLDRNFFQRELRVGGDR